MGLQSQTQTQLHSQSQFQSQTLSTPPVAVPPRFYQFANGKYFESLHTVGRRAYIRGIQHAVHGHCRDQSWSKNESPWSLPADQLPKATFIVIIRVQLDSSGVYEFGSTDEQSLSLEKEYSMTQNGADNWVALKVLLQKSDGTKTRVAYVADEDTRVLKALPDLEDIRLKYLHVQNYLGLLFPITEYGVRSHFPTDPLSQPLLPTPLQPQFSVPTVPLSLYPFYNFKYLNTLHPIGRQPYIQGLSHIVSVLHKQSQWPLPASCLPTATLNVIIRVRGMRHCGHHRFRSTDEVVLRKQYNRFKDGVPKEWPTLNVLVKDRDGNQKRVANVAQEDNFMVRDLPDLEKAKLIFMNVQSWYQAHFALVYPTSQYDLGSRVPMMEVIDFSSSQVEA